MLAGLKTLFLTLPISLVLISCRSSEESTQSEAPQSDSIRAKTISKDDYLDWWNRSLPTADTPEVRESRLKTLAERTQLVEAARMAGLESDPVVINAYESLLISRLKEQQLEPLLEELTVSDEEITAEYQRVRTTRFQTGDRKRLAVLWLNSRGQQPLALRYQLKLKSLRKDLQSGRVERSPDGTFGQLAIKNTEHTASRYKGGDLGWVELKPNADPWLNAIVGIANRLKDVGELSEVVTNDLGVFLVRLVDERPAQEIPLERVKNELRRKLLTEKREGAKQAFSDQISRNHPVEIDHDSIREIPSLPTRATTKQATITFPTTK